MSFPAYPEYKDSGVEWLGELPQHWRVGCLKHALIELISGGTPESSNSAYWADGDGVPWVAISDMTKGLVINVTAKTITEDGLRSKGLKVIPAGGLLYSIYASIGKVAVLGLNAVTNQAILGLVVNDTVADQQFVRWWLVSLEGWVKAVSSSNTQDNLNAEKVRNLPLAFPPLAEQTKIARFLDHEAARIDALIEVQQRLIELLKEKRQAMISHAITKGLDPTVPMKDSGVEWLGEVPAHWDVSRLKYHSTRIGDGLHSTPEYDDAGDYFFINGNNLAGGAITISPTTRQVNRQEFLKHRVLLDSSTVLISINGTIGNLALYSGEPVILGKSAAYINCTESLSPSFCLYLFSSEQIKRFFESQLTGTTIYNLSLRTIAETPTPLPSIDEQNSIVEFLNRNVDGFDELIDNAMKLAQLLEERRSALISAAVTGKIDVRGWQPPVSVPSPVLEAEAV